MEEDKVHHVATEAGKRLNEIESLFNPGVKISLLVRTPGHNDRDFVLTNDDLEEVIKAFVRRKVEQDEDMFSELLTKKPVKDGQN